MKITKALFVTLLQESPSFRSHVANVVFGEDFHLQVVETVMNADGKIDAIKKVRTLAKENESEFKLAFPRVEWFQHNDGSRGLGLATSKRLVESIRSNW